MRREGFELSVSPPRVVFREEAGKRLEPIEEVGCEVADEHAGEVIEAMSNRKGEVGPCGCVVWGCVGEVG